MSATLARGLTVLAVALLIGGAYRLNHAIVQENVLGLFPTARTSEGLTAAAGVSKQPLATTTTTKADAKKEGGKGFTGLIQDLLKIGKKAVTEVPPVTPEEPPVTPEVPPLSPEDPPATEEPDASDVLEPVDEPADDLVDEVPPEDDYLDDSYEDFYEEIPYEDFADEYPLEEYPYEEYVYEEVPLDNTVIPYDVEVETPAAPVPTAAKPAAKKVLVPATATKKLPDLYVGEIVPLFVAGKSSIYVNEPIGFNLRIDNAGRAEAASFTTRVRIDAGADGSFEVESLIAPQGPLPLNATQRLVASYVVERAAPGRHIAEICVDSTGAVAETSERNNCRRIEFSVAGSVAAPTVAPPGYQVYQSVVNFLSGFLN